MKCFLIIIMVIIVLLQSGCKYDKQELLNPVSSACDTAIVTYSGSINPILTVNCISCHSGSNAPFNIKLDVYADVNAQALNGNLLGAITHASGFPPMPEDGSKLSDCNIDKIKNWINAGAPNN